MTGVSPKKVMLVICIAQLFSQMGAYTLPALLPSFISEWSLSNSEAGWLTGIFYGAYMISVPFLVPLTDRIDPKKIYVSSVFMTLLAHLGFVFVAHDFIGGLIFRILAGFGWAGTYMPGLKILADHLTGKLQTRSVSFHAASVGIAGSLSFIIAATLERFGSWHTAFISAALFTFIALILAVVYIPRQLCSSKISSISYSNFVPILKNFSSVAYSLCYFSHTWEMFVQRSWIVVFLAYVAADSGTSTLFVSPVYIPFVVGLLGTWASISGNEVAMKVGRQKWVLGVSFASMATLVLVALSVNTSLYTFVAGLCLIHGILIYADSSALTAGASGNADPARRGAQLALHSMLGYGGGFVGSVTFGVVLDFAGGQTITGWMAAFASVLLILVVGPIAIWWLKPNDLAGDAPWRHKRKS